MIGSFWRKMNMPSSKETEEELTHVMSLDEEAEFSTMFYKPTIMENNQEL